MKPFVAIAAILPVASAALRTRRLQNSMSIVVDDPGLPLTDLPIPSPGFPPCNICGEGGVITNPDAVLQIAGITQVKTCAEFDTDGENGLISETECDLLPLVTTTVCDCQYPLDPVPPPPSSQDKCSCSPRDFTFQLQLDRNCDTNTISDSPGVEVAVCNIRGGAGAGDIDYSTFEIVDIQFLEFGSGLEVINQNDTFTNTSLSIGDTFSFPSISNMLSPDMPIEEQSQYFPTAVTLNMEGKVKDSDGNEAGKEDPSPEFCPGAGPVPPSTTEATTPSTTTTANVVTTTSSSHSMITSIAPPLFGKSGKGTGKSAKSKTLKDPMAKVAKSVNDAKAEKLSKSSKSAKNAKMTKTSTKSKMFKLESSMSA
eukprot:scaffold1527_cov145-Skeletonema_menzelii.AAC.11